MRLSIEKHGVIAGGSIDVSYNPSDLYFSYSGEVKINLGIATKKQKFSGSDKIDAEKMKSANASAARAALAYCCCYCYWPLWFSSHIPAGGDWWSFLAQFFFPGWELAYAESVIFSFFGPGWLLGASTAHK